MQKKIQELIEKYSQMFRATTDEMVQDLNVLLTISKTQKTETKTTEQMKLSPAERMAKARAARSNKKPTL